ncbi:MAG: hypothetical protein IJU26_02885 [Synergistaceae bacterium]|nr:hypothetical protein [Synergistaceae bacterium]
MKHKIYMVLFALAVLACSAWGLIPRYILEKSNNNVAILADYREISTLAKNSGLHVDEAIATLMKNGMTGIMVSELIGDSLLHGIGQAEMKAKPRDNESALSTEGTIISINPYSEHRELLNKWLRLRFAISDDRTGPLLLTMPSNVLRNSGTIPDIDGLEAAKRAGLHIFYRPAPSPGHLADRAALMLREVHAKYPVSVFTPSGEYVSGYPDVSKLAGVSRELGIPVAVVEFSKQLGEPQLNRQVSPLLLPLHSVTNDEMTSRRITRTALRDRLIRAAVERAVRLLLLRTAPANTSSFRFWDFAEEVRLLGEELKAHGFALAWPDPVFARNDLHSSIFTAWALSAVLMLCVWRYLVRMGMNSKHKTMLLFATGSVVLAVCVLKVSAAARLAGALAAPMIAVEASLLAMDTTRKHQVLLGFGFAVCASLAMASFFSVSGYMLRLSTFSGVRLTLVLPPVLVVLHDLKRRVHPESVIEFLNRPPLWGELIMIMILLGGVGLMVFRSGNVAYTPPFEEKIRLALEHLLVARPRTKEVFVGYPCLLLLCYLVKNGMLKQYREVLRIGVAAGFSSVVNSFCHFHTPLTLILLREFHGLWTGILVGLVVVGLVKFVVVPVLKLIRPILS